MAINYKLHEEGGFHINHNRTISNILFPSLSELESERLYVAGSLVRKLGFSSQVDSCITLQVSDTTILHQNTQIVSVIAA